MTGAAAGDKLSDQVRRAVEASGRTLTDLAAAVGISKSQMSRFMAGKRGLSMDVLDRLAAVVVQPAAGARKK